MPAQLQVESCRAGFKSRGKAQLCGIVLCGYNERWTARLDRTEGLIQGRGMRTYLSEIITRFITLVLIAHYESLVITAILEFSVPSSLVRS